MKHLNLSIKDIFLYRYIYHTYFKIQFENKIFQVFTWNLSVLSFNFCTGNIQHSQAEMVHQEDLPKYPEQLCLELLKRYLVFRHELKQNLMIHLGLLHLLTRIGSLVIQCERNFGCHLTAYNGVERYSILFLLHSGK